MMSARENGGIRNQTAAGDRGISPQFVEGKKNTEYRNPTFSSSVFFTNNSSMDNGAKSARYNNRDSGLAQQRIVLDAGKVTEGAAGVVRGSRTPQRTVTASRHNPIVTQADVRDNNVSSRIVDSIEHRDYSNVTKRVQDTSVDHKQGGADIHTTYWKEDEDRRKELQNRSRIIKEQAEAAKTEKEEEKVRNKMQQIAYKQQLDDQLSDRKTHRQASVKKEQVLPSRVVLGEREVENRPEVLAVKRQQFVNDLERQVEEKYEQKRKVEEKEKGKMEKSIATKILDRKVKKEVVEQKKVLDQKRVREEDNRLKEKEEDRKLVNQMREWEVKKQQQDNENKMRQMKELKEVLTVQIQQRGQSPQKPTSYLGSNDGGTSHSPKKPVYRPVPAKPAPPAIQKKSPVPKKAGKTSAGGNK